VVKIYRNYESDTSIEVVSAWHALKDGVSIPPRSCMITDWQQSSGSLLVGGDSDFVRIWDLEREQLIQVFTYSFFSQKYLIIKIYCYLNLGYTQ
jgi:regulatory associated protein of mTOR